MDKETIHKELDLIQDIIKRMAHNSFQVKTWLMAVLAALIAFKNEEIFAGGGGDKTMAVWMNLFLLLPIFCFWYLDAFFLSTERLYRELYKWVITYRPETSDYLYDLNTFQRTVGGKEENLVKKGNDVWSIIWSKTLLPFYLVPLFFVIGLLCYNSF